MTHEQKPRPRFISRDTARDLTDIANMLRGFILLLAVAYGIVWLCSGDDQRRQRDEQIQFSLAVLRAQIESRGNDHTLYCIPDPANPHIHAHILDGGITYVIRGEESFDGNLKNP